MTQPRTVLYAGTRNLYKHMPTAVKSLLYHDSADEVILFIEDDEFPEPLPDCVRTINVSGQTVFPHNGPNYVSMWTYMALMRCALTKYFPELDRILTLDVDTIVRKPLDYLWNLDLSRYYFAAVEETGVRHHTRRPYYNFGIVMHNLRKLREEGVDDIIINSINSAYFRFPEQDAVNSVCNKHILSLGQEYNATHFAFPLPKEEDIVIKHYADTRGIPLDSHEDYQFFSKLSWDEVLQHGKAVKHG